MAIIPPSHQWIVGLCSIVFDIDVGQRVEHLVPAGCLSPQEQQNIAFHSFPDSMSMELHARTSIKDSTFFFRVRREGTAEAPALAAPTSAGADGSVHSNGDDAAGAAPAAAADGEAGSQAEERFLYGFVFCRQRQDASLRRGGEQLSVVVLAEHPLSSVLAPLSAVAGQQYFGTQGRAALQQVFDEVSRWPAPVAGPQLQLPVGFTSLTARLPAWASLPHPSAVTAPEQYGANTLVHARGASARTLTTGGATRRTLTNEDSAAPSAARASSAATPLSHAASSAMLQSPPNSAMLQSPMPAHSGGASVSGGMPVSVAAALAGSSPFSTSSGQQQTPDPARFPPSGPLSPLPPPAPPRQQLEPRRTSGSDPLGPGSGPTSASTLLAGLAAELSLGVGAAAGGRRSDSMGGALPSSREGSLQALPQLLLAGAEGCAPAAALQVLPLPLPAPLGHHHPAMQHRRSSVCVPSRNSSVVSMMGAGSEETAAVQHGGPGSNSSSLRALQGQASDVADRLAEDANGGSVGVPSRQSSSALRRLTGGAGGHPGLGGLGDGGAVSGAFHEVDVFTPLSGHLQRLWQLWEMTLLGRALLLVAPTPGEASAGVAALLSLVAPLPYAQDFRPFYCIHDAAFSRLSSGLLPGPEARDVPALLGVTNLYFIRALPHWPNILSVGKREGTAAAAVAPPGSLAAAFSANAAVQALRQRAQGASALLSGHTEALWSAYKPLARPDQALLSRLIQPKPGDVKSKVARIAFVNSDAIRRHFAELTTAFLSPFARYFEPGADGRVPGWNSEEFLFGLRSGVAGGLPQPLLDRVGNPAAAVELYARFTACLNFAAWFAARRRHVAHLIAPWPWTGEAAGAGAGGPGDAAAGEGVEGALASWFSSAAKHLDEVKMIGMFFSVEQQLMEAQFEAASPDAADEASAALPRLQRELVLLFFSGLMPEELQLTCISSPARAALLSSLPLTPGQAASLKQLLDKLHVMGK